MPFKLLRILGRPRAARLFGIAKVGSPPPKAGPETLGDGGDCCLPEKCGEKIAIPETIPDMPPQSPPFPCLLFEVMKASDAADAPKPPISPRIM